MTEYRADIDGLRAIAVLSVIAFHNFPLHFHGGYVGVDIFFVISGFLICSTVLNELKAKKFSFLNFYTRRIRRIFPALLLLLFFCMVLGWFTLFDYEYKLLGKYIAGTAGFVANVIAWRESGYFEPAAEIRPLLQMWSLGVEEQFYFLWPFLVWLVWKTGRSQVALCVCVVIASLLYYLSIIKAEPSLAFYSPFSRVWQLICGSLLAAATSPRCPPRLDSAKKSLNPILKKLNIPASVFGVSLLIVAIFGFDNEKNFSGARTLPATLGAFLILGSNPKVFLNRVILSNRVMVWIGLISYPLYLWHWSLLSYVHIFKGESPKPFEKIVVISFSFVMAWLTYRFVETPIRGRSSSSGKLKTLALCSLMILAGVLGYNIYRQEGFIDRKANAGSGASSLNSGEALFQLEFSDCNDDIRIHQKIRKFCTKHLSTDRLRPTIVLWGDSSSDAWRPVFLHVAKELDFSVIVFSHPSCLPLIGIRMSQYPEGKEYCNDLSLGYDVVESIRRIAPQMIFLLGAWNSFSPGRWQYVTESSLENADEKSNELALKNRIPNTILKLESISKLVVFRAWPELNGLPNYRVRLWQKSQKVPLRKYSEHRRESKFVDEIFDSIKTKRTIFLDPSKVVCNFFCDFLIGGRRVYRDSYHVTQQGSLLLKDQIKNILEEL